MNNLEQLNKIKDIYGQPKTIMVGDEEAGVFELTAHPLSEEDILPLGNIDANDIRGAMDAINKVISSLLQVSIEEAKSLPLKIKMELADFVNTEYAKSDAAPKAEKALKRFRK